MFDSTCRAMLRSICEHHDDDAVRLVYADYLEEHGQPERAEFIRVQVALARGHDPAMASREAELLAAHGDAWRMEVPEWARPRCGFRRGFVAEVRCSVVDWLAGAEELVAWTPVEEVFFVPGPTDAAALAKSAALSRVRTLILCNAGLGGNGIRELFHEVPNLHNLRELYLAGNDLGDETGFYLVHCAALKRLTELDLRDNRIGDLGATWLATPTQFRELTTLYLVNNQIGDEGAMRLAEGPWAGLEHLYLNHNQVGDRGALVLASSPALAHLRELDLRDNRINDDGAGHLAESPHLGNLRELLLRGNPIGQHAIAMLRQRFGDRLKM